MAKRTNKAPAKIEAYRVNESLSGTDLFTYTLAVFIFLGLFKKSVKSGAITSFYNSGSILRHHKANGNMEKKDGKIALTAKGKAHFLSRYSDTSAQYVEKSDAGMIAKAIKSGNMKDMPKEWAGEVTLSKITIMK